MTKYQFKTYDETLINFLDKQSTKSDAIKNILTKYVQGDLVSKQDPDVEYKILRNQDLKKRIEERIIEIEIKKQKLQYWKIFGATPSRDASKAIVQGVKQKFYRELTNEEVNQISNHIAFETTFDGFRITCKHCNLQVTYKDRLESLHEASRHLSGVHGTEILQK